jgi:hypothetical protein
VKLHSFGMRQEFHVTGRRILVTLFDLLSFTALWPAAVEKPEGPVQFLPGEVLLLQAAPT